MPDDKQPISITASVLDRIMRAVKKSEQGIRFGSGINGYNDPDTLSIAAFGQKRETPRSSALPDDVIPCAVYNDGGVAGSPTTDCSLTYTLRDLAGATTLKNADGSDATARIPATPRYSNCEYNIPAENSPGLAYRDTDGAWRLYSVAQEKPKGDVVTNVTAIQFDTATGKLQVKTRSELVLEAADESPWTDITADYKDCT